MNIEIMANIGLMSRRFEKIISGLKTIPVKQAADLIRADVENNLNTAQSFDGSEITPLKESYREWKRAKGWSTDIFKAEKLWLIRAVRTKQMGKNRYRVFIADHRAKIMRYLQEGRAPLAGPRRAFGVSKKIIDKITKLMNDWSYKLVA